MKALSQKFKLNAFPQYPLRKPVRRCAGPTYFFKPGENKASHLNVHNILGFSNP